MLRTSGFPQETSENVPAGPTPEPTAAKSADASQSADTPTPAKTTKPAETAPQEPAASEPEANHEAAPQPAALADHPPEAQDAAATHEPQTEHALTDEHNTHTTTGQDAAGHDAHGSDAGGSVMERAMRHYLDVGHLFEHVQDASYIEFPKFLGGKVHLPNPLGRTKESPLIQVGGYPLLTGQFTKFMALELVGAALLCFFFITAARKTRQGEPARGRLANLLEVFVVFIRDEIARPAIGHKDASRFLPFLLTLFFFILILNLIGMLPWFGSVTGSISVTAVLALVTFLIVIGSGMKKMGVVGFLKAQVPHMDLPPAMAFVLTPMIWCIEMFGLLVKHFVLAIRLFANMFGGHLVLAAFMAFAGVGVAAGVLGWGISLGAIAFSIAFSLLELLVAFLQAYIFTFLAALFIGSAQHAH